MPTVRSSLRSLLALAAALSLLPTLAAAGNPLDSLVGVRANIPADARTAETLGRERNGSGVVIDEDGLVLTIGYLIMESTSAEILLPDGRDVPAEVAAYDYDTGFGLLRPLVPIDVAPVSLGSAEGFPEDSRVLVASFDGAVSTTPAIVVSRRDFAGYWEYLLPDAIFTTPPHAGFGGAALLGPQGQLVGIGSLVVGDALPENQPLPGNMFVPIDALKPIFEDLLRDGRSTKVRKPWLGLFSEVHRGAIFVTRVAPDGPADQAGITADDVVVAVDGQRVRTLIEFYRAVWALGEPGVTVPLTVVGGDGPREVEVRSADRYDYLKLQTTF